MIKHSPAAIADSSLSLRRGSKRSTRNVGFRRPCDVSRAERNGKRIATHPAADMTVAVTAEMVVAEMEDTPPARASSIRRSARIAAVRPKFRSFPGRTSRCIAGIASRRCAGSNSLAIRITSPGNPTAFETRLERSGRVCYSSASSETLAVSWSWRM